MSGSSPGNPWLYFPEIEDDLLKVELMHQWRVSTRAPNHGDHVVPPAGRTDCIAEPALKDLGCMRFSRLVQSIPPSTRYMQQIQACMYTHKHTDAPRHALARAAEKGVGGVTQAAWVTLTQSLCCNTHHCHSVTPPTGWMNCSPTGEDKNTARGEDADSNFKSLPQDLKAPLRQGPSYED